MQKINVLAVIVLVLPVCAFAGNPIGRIQPPTATPVKALPDTTGNNSPAALLGAEQTPAASATQGQSATQILDQLRTQELILTEELNVVKLKEKIAEAQSGSQGAGGRSGRAVSVLLPSVRSMGGVKGHYTAELVYPDGSTLAVHEGGQLSDGSRVIHIGRDGVVVATAVGIRTLPMAEPERQGGMNSNNVTPLSAPPIQQLPMSTDSTHTEPKGNGP